MTGLVGVKQDLADSLSAIDVDEPSIGRTRKRDGEFFEVEICAFTAPKQYTIENMRIHQSQVDPKGVIGWGYEFK